MHHHRGCRRDLCYASGNPAQVPRLSKRRALRQLFTTYHDRTATSTHNRIVSDSSTSAIESILFGKAVLELLHNEHYPTSDHIEKAQQIIQEHSSTARDDNKFIFRPGKAKEQAVNVCDLLEATIEHAPCASGTRFAACAVCVTETEEGIRALANDWLKYLLLPCMLSFVLPYLARNIHHHFSFISQSSPLTGTRIRTRHPQSLRLRMI